MIQELEKKFNEVYYLEQGTLHLRLVIATVLSTLLPTKPIWLLLVGGSGVGKTATIDTVSEVKFCHNVSEMTSNTLLSGMKKTKNGEEPSLLLRIDKKSTLLLKDFTTILSKREDERRAIFSQLREVYDGSFTKNTGTGVNPSWKGKVNIVGGVTTAFYERQAEFDSMGARFIVYELNDLSYEGRLKYMDFAIKHSNLDNEEKELRALGKKVVDYYMSKLYGNLPDIPDKLFTRLKLLAELTTRARTPVSRDYRGNYVIAHNKELPARLMRQVYVLGQILLYMAQDEGREELNEVETKGLFKLLLDSIPKQKRLILKHLYLYRQVSTEAMVSLTGMPFQSVKVWLEDLFAQGVIGKLKQDITTLWYLPSRERGVMLDVLGGNYIDKTADLNEEGDIVFLDRFVSESSKIDVIAEEYDF